VYSGEGAYFLQQVFQSPKVYRLGLTHLKGEKLHIL